MEYGSGTPTGTASAVTGAWGHLKGTWTVENSLTTSDRRLKQNIKPLFRELQELQGTSSRGGVLTSRSKTTQVHQHAATTSANSTKTRDPEEVISSSDAEDEVGILLIRKLRPVSFHYKDGVESKLSRFGFVAQEVETVLPALVSQAPSGYKVLNLKDLIAVLTLGLQNLETKTSSVAAGSLEAKISNLATTVDADDKSLKTRLVRLLEDVKTELEHEDPSREVEDPVHGKNSSPRGKNSSPRGENNSTSSSSTMSTSAPSTGSLTTTLDVESEEAAAWMPLLERLLREADIQLVQR
ncbi:unnamed protein product [Amoebophrya sp. A25]|nr:unnamed protein product [Amoebophrya sp. A25]|eukprot:GSA25T00023712001.1